MKDRGMKKWLPYKSLNQQGDFMDKMLRDREKTHKPLISSEKASEINDILVNYDGREVIASYYEGGYVYRIKGRIRRIDASSRMLLLNETPITFSSLFGLDYLN